MDIEDDFLEPEENSEELIGRYVLNSFGTREVVVLPYSSWRYLDWLETQGVIIDCFTADAHNDNQIYYYAPFHALLGERIHQAYRYRLVNELDQPPYLQDSFEVMFWKNLN